MHELLIITKKEAEIINQKWYFTNQICKNGHLDKRYTSTGICYSCKREQIKRDYKKHPKRIKETNKKSNIKNAQRVKETHKKWVKKNRDKSNKIKKNYKIKNRKKYLRKCREYMRNKRKDPFFRLSKNTSKSIWESLKNKKGGKHWESFVSFTLEDLIKHLESQFTDIMNWENYGKVWHLDHIKPLSWFDLELEFNEAWSLNNLQPLLSKENLSKNNRYSGKYNKDF